jgi:imidazolonepropionase
MRSLITQIGTLHQIESGAQELRFRKGPDMQELPFLTDAYLLMEDGLIADFGSMGQLPDTGAGTIHWDARSGHVIPCWCDSHTHLVYAGSREGEFMDRIRGMGYAEIAARGGGILHSARLLAETEEGVLLEEAMQRLTEISLTGTGAVEIKSGYGLTLEGELKMLRVIRALKERSGLTIKSTFLAAHAFPEVFKKDPDGYVKLIIDVMLPRVAAEGLADFMDVFCEKGFFTVSQTERLLEAGWKHGLQPKVHANQLSSSGAIQAAVKWKALTVDHAEHLEAPDLDCLKSSATLVTLLPSAALFLGLSYRDTARKLIEASVPVALASDFNPGSSPGGNMPLVLSLACIQLHMTAREAVNAATLNGAAAMGLEASHGTIRRGKKAHVIITRPMPSLEFFPYSLGRPLIEKVVISGQI